MKEIFIDFRSIFWEANIAVKFKVAACKSDNLAASGSRGRREITVLLIDKMANTYTCHYFIFEGRGFQRIAFVTLVSALSIY